MDFQTIHALLSCMGGLRMCRIFTAGGGDWIKIVSDQIVERNVRSVGSRGLLKGSWCPWWDPGTEPLEAPGFLGF